MKQQSLLILNFMTLLLRRLLFCNSFIHSICILLLLNKVYRKKWLCLWLRKTHCMSRIIPRSVLDIWEALGLSVDLYTCTNCFIKCGIHPGIGLGTRALPDPEKLETTEDQSDDDDDPFLDIPLSQYSQILQKYKDEYPSRVPTTTPSNTSESDSEAIATDYDTPAPPPITLSDVMKKLGQINHFCVGDEHAMSLIDKLKIHITDADFKQELHHKCIQSTILNFFKI